MPVFRPLCTKLRGEREADEHEEADLERRDDLHVGESRLVIEDEGGESRDRADVREHGAHVVSAARKGVLVAASEGQIGDGAGYEHEERTEERQPEEAFRQRHDPEAQDGEQRRHDDDVEADEDIALRVGDAASLIGDVAREKGRGEVGEYVEDAEEFFVHERPLLLDFTGFRHAGQRFVLRIP